MWEHNFIDCVENKVWHDRKPAEEDKIIFGVDSSHKTTALQE